MRNPLQYSRGDLPNVVVRECWGSLLTFSNEIYSLQWFGHFILKSDKRNSIFNRINSYKYMLLKQIFKWNGFVIILEIITSWACLFISELNDIYNVHLDLLLFFFQFQLNSCILALWAMKCNNLSSASCLIYHLIGCSCKLEQIT